MKEWLSYIQSPTYNWINMANEEETGIELLKHTNNGHTKAFRS
jgi:hypothetical protein